MHSLALRTLVAVALIVSGTVSLMSLTLSGEGGAAYACGGEADPCPPTPTISVGATSTSPGSTPTGGDEPPKCVFNGSEIPCTSPQGIWYAPRGCYVSEVPRSLWPPAGDPMYGGKDPSDGSVWWCNPPNFTGLTEMIFISVGDPPVIDPTILVWAAIVEMDLQPINVGTAPNAGSDSVGLVGLPTWMWVNQPSAHTFGPITATDADGPVSVTATARVTAVDWDMGDGTVVTCHGPGTPYAASYGDQASPDCGHRYQRSSAGQPDGRYAVTATSHWDISWTASTGASGVIRLTRIANTYLRIGEMQVLVQ